MPSPASAVSDGRAAPSLEPNQNERAHLAAAEIARAMKGVERTEPVAELPENVQLVTVGDEELQP